ncbi:MAG TPA: FtsK/SpoIIIE domain-containing protein [Isosphaeraceae bacterium]|jgi:hypothetical protein|nr:FtsK/SpoIIIE domain-containing protein [Isosphaeraceae bacterium]
MTVELQVRDVREELYRASGGPAGAGVGQASTALLGRLFHEVFAELVASDSCADLSAVLDDAEPTLEAWKRALVHHTYHRAVGSRLQQNQALLHESAECVLAFWRAVQELCGWLAELHWTLRQAGPARSVPATRKTIPAGLITVEQPLAWELHEPRWTDVVRLTGVADSVIRPPGTDHWCVVELKLGRTAPEADLAQICLYHEMLAASTLDLKGAGARGTDGAGTLVLVSFVPERREQLFEASALGEVQQRLRHLIGRMAGVLPEERPVRAEPVVAVATPEHQELGRKLIATLEEYGAQVILDGPPIAGPTFLRFPVTLGPSIRLATVKGRANEVRVRLGLEAPPRIGVERGRVVIDVQRPDRRYIAFSEIQSQLPPADPLSGCAEVPLGVDLEGKLRLATFAQPENAHILVAGTTGSGKSEWLRAAVAGLLVTNSPQTLRLLLIDPKRNAFAGLRDSPFLFAPIVYPDEQAGSELLKRLADEMDARYQQMSQTGADAWAEHVARLGTPLPRIVCVCDEYADLIMQDREERKRLEQQIFRLGAKARAAGIHLILATQQPSREIIKGALDANMPTRVGLKMEKVIESRMLLGSAGAEALLGNGDLLFKDIGEPVRLQSAYLSPDERDRIFRLGS